MPARFAIARAEGIIVRKVSILYAKTVVGIASGGRNPWPILDSDRTVTDDEIQISYDVLKATADELPKFFQ